MRLRIGRLPVCRQARSNPRGNGDLGGTIQCRPGSQRVYIVSPMYDLSVLNRDDRDEPVVIGRTTGENPSVYFVLKDHDATILSAMYNKCIAGVKFDGLAVSGEAGHQISSSLNRYRPAREVVAGLEDYAIVDRIEIVFPINQLTQTSQDDFKEWIQGFENTVFRFFHWQLLGVR